MAKATKPQTNVLIADAMAEAMQIAIAAQHSDTLAKDVAKHFVPLAGGSMAEYSQQVQYAEDVLGQIITRLEIGGMSGHTFAIAIETGKYAKCFGRSTRTKRLDNGQTVLSVVIHIADFSLDLINFVIKVLHAFAHALTVAGSDTVDKLEYGVGQNGVHNADFAANFQLFGTTVPKDRKNPKQHMPVALNVETISAIERLKVDHSAVILTGTTEERVRRAPAKTLNLACPTDAAHFASSHYSKRYRGTKPVINLDCGKCKTKITHNGYVANVPKD
jgi:hypothetical protein